MLARRRRRWAWLGAAATVLILAGGSPVAVEAQRADAAGVRARTTTSGPTGASASEQLVGSTTGARAGELMHRESATADSLGGVHIFNRVPSARWAPVASAVLPGAGQAMLRQNRFVPYLALEAYAWLHYIADSREGARQREGYRRLARLVARNQFPGAAPTGNWEYYERMEHYVESGVYDVDPGGVVQPEPDTTTFNGSVWLLARQTYWEDPNAPPDPTSEAYAKAIQFYTQRAVAPDYRWSWRDAQLEQDLFRRTIARSNDYYRRAAQDVAVVIANHVLSTVDSYVTVRLRSRRGAGVGRGLVPGGPSDGYDLTVRLPLPRR